MKKKYIMYLELFVISFFVLTNYVIADIYSQTYEYKKGLTQHIQVQGGSTYDGTLYDKLEISTGGHITQTYPINRMLISKDTAVAILKDLVKDDKYNIDAKNSTIQITYNCDGNPTLILNFSTNSLTFSSYKTYEKRNDYDGVLIGYETAKINSSSASYDKKAMNSMVNGTAGRDLFYLDKQYSVRGLATILGATVMWTPKTSTVIISNAKLLMDLPNYCGVE